tara:strand:+ start:1172 stop:1804 length:633 start_codon:yes stop_codon:yes gene_type:complete
MKIVSVILARGGSKGIPKKNVVNFNNKPLIYHTINASLNSKIKETWVSTDDQEITEISDSIGANVLQRPSNLATDVSQSEDALLHFAENVDFDMLVFIQPTSPLLYGHDIDKGINMMNNYDSVFSAYKEHWYPRWTKQFKPNKWDINNRPRRQDVEEQYVENGAFYITTKQGLLKSRLRYSGNIGIVEMPLWRSFQVDTLQDLNLMEKLI